MKHAAFFEGLRSFLILHSAFFILHCSASGSASVDGRSASGLSRPWQVNASVARVTDLPAVFHGDEFELRADFRDAAGNPFILPDGDWKLYFQTNGMDSLYFGPFPASASSNTVSAVFSPTNDPGASQISGFLSLPGSNYHAAFRLRFLPSPGATPNALPLPSPTLNFATTTILNPPWPAEIESLSNTLTQAIADATPADYATVSNLAHSAVQPDTLDAALSAKADYAVISTNDYWLPTGWSLEGRLTRSSSSVWEGFVINHSMELDYGITITNLWRLWYTRVSYGDDYNLIWTLEDGCGSSSEEYTPGYGIPDALPSLGLRRVVEVVTNTVVYSDTLAAATNATLYSAGELARQQVTTLSNNLSQAIADAAPADYANVSNLAYSAVQDESDPTISAWAKASTKPSYTPNEIFKDAANWIGAQGNAGRIIKLLAQTIGGVIMGGYQVTGSTLNDNNTTTYAFGGVAVRRDGANEDYLWDAASTNGIVRRKELDGYKPKQTAKASPSASGDTYQFIDTISQDTNGVITATKKSVRTATTSQTGIVKLSSATNSTSTTLAATPSAVKAVRDEVGSLAASIPDWAKSETPPLSEESDPSIGLTNGTIYVHGDTLTPLTQHQSLSGYVPTSRTVNSKALSANITLSASDVGAAPSSLSSTVNTISGKVSALETWSIGNDTQLRVENAGATNATLTVLYTNKVMYASATAESNTLAKAAAYTDASALELAQAFDSALASDAWGERTSSGAPSPADTLIIEKEKVALTGGGNYSYIESSTGGYWVMAVSLGSTWTLESLADAQNPTNAATITLFDAEGNAVQTVTSTSSREAYAVEGEQYISVANVGGNDVITIAYPIVADSAPTLLFSPVVAGLDDFHTYDYWPSNIASVVASGASGMWTNTVTMVGHPGQGFFRAKYTKAGQTYTSFNKPLGLSQIVIGGTTYDLAVETINNKKLIVLTEAE